jgi:hypothetical protein
MDYQSDIDLMLSYRFSQGADYWTTPDNRLSKGSPFSLLESVLYLLELGVNHNDPILSDCANIIFSSWRENGRIKIVPEGAYYPCHTIHATNVLCNLGYVKEIRVQKTLHHLLEIQNADGGWRCMKFSYGKGEETNYSNPFPTLIALNIFRFTSNHNNNPALEKAIDFLLEHWIIRKPIGPCHYGIGSLFMEIEYPFRTYNLFSYVYILSFYKHARIDPRFIEAFKTLESKLCDHQVVVERVVPKMAKLSFCAKGEPSELATRRYNEICINISQDRQSILDQS